MICRAANAKAMREWTAKNREKINKSKRDRRKNDPVFREKNRLKCLAYSKRNSQKNRARAKKWQQENRERYLANQKRICREKSAGYVARAKRWKKANPERAKAIAVHSFHSRRAKIKATESPCAAILIKRWRAQKTFTCAYCKKSFPIKRLQIEHVIPIARGGLHKAGNLAKSCGPCNLKKATKLPIEFFERPDSMRET